MDVERSMVTLALVFFRRRLRQKKRRIPRRIAASAPPTAPPIVPALLEFESFEEVLSAVWVAVVVDVVDDVLADGVLVASDVEDIEVEVEENELEDMVEVGATSEVERVV